MNKTEIRIGTRRYELSHGRTPRGRGQWGFEIVGLPTIWESGTFNEAKKAATKKIAAMVPEGSFVYARVLA